jgi:hypothetical protein
MFKKYFKKYLGFFLLDIGQRKQFCNSCLVFMTVSGTFGLYFYELPKGTNWWGVWVSTVSVVSWWILGLMVARGTEKF